jgi:hypothetical protein
MQSRVLDCVHTCLEAIQWPLKLMSGTRSSNRSARNSALLHSSIRFSGDAPRAWQGSVTQSQPKLSRRENFADENVTSNLNIVSENCGPLIVNAAAEGVP